MIDVRASVRDEDIKSIRHQELSTAQQIFLLIYFYIPFDD